jgi:putative CocE/NonD family hydrolase
MAMISRVIACACLLVSAFVFAEEPAASPEAHFDMRWGVKIPMRDAVQLDAIAYFPKDQKVPVACLFSLSPYTAQNNHARASYFAARGYPFLSIDARGRGNSQGDFRPFIQEAQDGYDIVEWLARQPYCNGRVAMFSGSYEGYNQWATAKEFPPHLTTIIPGMSVGPGLDFPMRNNIFTPYAMQWLISVRGRASQGRISGDSSLWAANNRRSFEMGQPFQGLDIFLGASSTTFQEWVSHPYLDAYWDAYRPTAEQYRRMNIPVLTLTGSYDDDQPGALSYYREFVRDASPEELSRHYLVIGPWDHGGTLQPRAAFGGLKFGPAALVDILKLHVDWYAWTMQGGPKPEFLKRLVSYYVMGAEKWRYADTLDGITAHSRPYFLSSSQNPTDVFAAGSLSEAKASGKEPDHYLYDPWDLSSAAVEAGVDPDSLTDQRIIYAARGKEFIYHTAPFEKDTELSGFFKLSAWISIDQPDTDFQVAVYEIGSDGNSIKLSTDVMRARYRQSLRKPVLINTREPLRYDFEHFTFTSRQIRKGSRLRLVFGPINSIYSEKNYNSGGVVAGESIKDARSVTVKLYHDRAHPSALYVPIGQSEDTQSK